MANYKFIDKNKMIDSINSLYPSDTEQQQQVAKVKDVSIDEQPPVNAGSFSSYEQPTQQPTPVATDSMLDTYYLSKASEASNKDDVYYTTLAIKTMQDIGAIVSSDKNSIWIGAVKNKNDVKFFTENSIRPDIQAAILNTEEGRSALYDNLYKSGYRGSNLVDALLSPKELTVNLKQVYDSADPYHKALYANNGDKKLAKEYLNTVNARAAYLKSHSVKTPYGETTAEWTPEEEKLSKKIITKDDSEDTKTVLAKAEKTYEKPKDEVLSKIDEAINISNAKNKVQDIANKLIELENSGSLTQEEKQKLLEERYATAKSIQRDYPITLEEYYLEEWDWKKPVPLLPSKDTYELATEILPIVLKIRKGIDLSIEETLKIQDFQIEFEEKTERGMGIAATIADIANTAPAFMIAFGIGKKLVGDAAKVVTQKTLRNILGDFARRTIPKYAIKATGTAASGAAMTVTVGLPYMAKTALEEYVYNPEATPISTLYKSFVDTWAEFVGEQTGVATHKALRGFMRRYLPKTLSIADEILDRRTIKALEKVGWNGTLEEMTEERFSALLRAIFSDAELKDVIPSKEQLIAEGIGFAISGTALTGAARIENMYNNRKINNLYANYAHSVNKVATEKLSSLQKHQSNIQDLYTKYIPNPELQSDADIAKVINEHFSELDDDTALWLERSSHASTTDRTIRGMPDGVVTAGHIEALRQDIDFFGMLSQADKNSVRYKKRAEVSTENVNSYMQSIYDEYANINYENLDNIFSLFKLKQEDIDNIYSIANEIASTNKISNKKSLEIVSDILYNIDNYGLLKRENKVSIPEKSVRQLIEIYNRKKSSLSLEQRREYLYNRMALRTTPQEANYMINALDSVTEFLERRGSKEIANFYLKNFEFIDEAFMQDRDWFGRASVYSNKADIGKYKFFMSLSDKAKYEINHTMVHEIMHNLEDVVTVLQIEASRDKRDIKNRKQSLGVNVRKATTAKFIDYMNYHITNVVSNMKYKDVETAKEETERVALGSEAFFQQLIAKVKDDIVENNSFMQRLRKEFYYLRQEKDNLLVDKITMNDTMYAFYTDVFSSLLKGYENFTVTSSILNSTALKAASSKNNTVALSTSFSARMRKLSKKELDKLNSMVNADVKMSNVDENAKVAYVVEDAKGNISTDVDTAEKLKQPTNTKQKKQQFYDVLHITEEKVVDEDALANLILENYLIALLEQYGASNITDINAVQEIVRDIKQNAKEIAKANKKRDKNKDSINRWISARFAIEDADRLNATNALPWFEKASLAKKEARADMEKLFEDYNIYKLMQKVKPEENKYIVAYLDNPKSRVDALPLISSEALDLAVALEKILQGAGAIEVMTNAAIRWTTNAKAIPEGDYIRKLTDEERSNLLKEIKKARRKGELYNLILDMRAEGKEFGVRHGFYYPHEIKPKIETDPVIQSQQDGTSSLAGSSLKRRGVSAPVEGSAASVIKVHMEQLMTLNRTDYPINRMLKEIAKMNLTKRDAESVAKIVRSLQGRPEHSVNAAVKIGSKATEIFWLDKLTMFNTVGFLKMCFRNSLQNLAEAGWTLPVIQGTNKFSNVLIKTIANKNDLKTALNKINPDVSEMLAYRRVALSQRKEILENIFLISTTDILTNDKLKRTYSRYKKLIQQTGTAYGTIDEVQRELLYSAVALNVFEQTQKYLTSAKSKKDFEKFMLNTRVKGTGNNKTRKILGVLAAKNISDRNKCRVIADEIAMQAVRDVHRVYDTEGLAVVQMDASGRLVTGIYTYARGTWENNYRRFMKQIVEGITYNDKVKTKTAIRSIATVMLGMFIANRIEEYFAGSKSYSLLTMYSPLSPGVQDVVDAWNKIEYIAYRLDNEDIDSKKAISATFKVLTGLVLQFLPEPYTGIKKEYKRYLEKQKEKEQYGNFFYGDGYKQNRSNDKSSSMPKRPKRPERKKLD